MLKIFMWRIEDFFKGGVLPPKKRGGDAKEIIPL
jgi:hypothetical protein